jgi:hypothetical protein
LPIPFSDYKLPIHQSPLLQSIPHGCELSKFGSQTERSEQKKLMSEANSESLLLFLKITKILTKNCPDESSESEIQ